MDTEIPEVMPVVLNVVCSLKVVVVNWVLLVLGYLEVPTRRRYCVPQHSMPVHIDKYLTHLH